MLRGTASEPFVLEVIIITLTARSPAAALYDVLVFYCTSALRTTIWAYQLAAQLAYLCPLCHLRSTSC
jgi:hypothetical protein